MSSDEEHVQGHKILDAIQAQVKQTLKNSNDGETKSSKWDNLPPLHLWNPPLSGEMNLVITKEGKWLYESNEIKREKIIQLFSRILKKEGEDYFLVTPVEKWLIQVEDCPWIIIDTEIQETGIVDEIAIFFTSNIGEKIELSKEHPLTVKTNEEGDVPYITVRNGIDARLNRQSYYTLCEHAVEDDCGRYIIRCRGGSVSLGWH